VDGSDSGEWEAHIVFHSPAICAGQENGTEEVIAAQGNALREKIFASSTTRMNVIDTAPSL
jgi:hypothetical protein